MNTNRSSVQEWSVTVIFGICAPFAQLWPMTWIPLEIASHPYFRALLGGTIAGLAIGLPFVLLLRHSHWRFWRYFIGLYLLTPVIQNPLVLMMYIPPITQLSFALGSGCLVFIISRTRWAKRA